MNNKTLILALNEITRAILTGGLTATDILTMLKTVDGSGSGLDADMLRGLVPGVATGNIATHPITTVSNNDSKFGLKSGIVSGPYWQASSGGGFDFTINNPAFYTHYRLATRQSGGGMWIDLNGYILVQDGIEQDFAKFAWTLTERDTYQDFAKQTATGAIALFTINSNSSAAWLDFQAHHVMSRTPNMQVIVSCKWL